MSLLSCTGLSAGYTGATVVRDLDIHLEKGEVLALLGPNGAGKTTALMALTGLHPRTSGTVSIDGLAIRSNKPRAAAKAGLVLVPDDRSLFKTLTVMENLKLAATSAARIDETLDLFPRLKERLDVHAGLLSGGEQQMLAIGRGLVQDPKVLLIDELSMGLAPVIVQALLPVIRQVADAGTAVVLVEQHVALALATADRAMVLVHGSIALEGSASDLADDTARVEAAYLGASLAAR